MKDVVDALVEKGLVKKVPCPVSGKLFIYSYRSVAGKKEWAEYPELRACRGLVMDEKGLVIARPFDKFFNLGEVPETKAEALPADVPVMTEKLDGSLVIVFFDPINDRWRAITRGSWDSQQAKWAQTFIEGPIRHGLNLFVNKDTCLMFELTAPWNRIVCVYKDTRLTLLGARWITGDEMDREDLTGIAERLHLPLVTQFSNATHGGEWAAAGNHPSNFTNQEGYVCRYSNGLRVKIKYPAYVRLHRMMTEFSVKSIWEALRDGQPIDVDGLPAEWVSWHADHVGALMGQFNSLLKAVEFHYQQAAIGGCPVAPTFRRELALRWASERPSIRAALFAKLDGKDYSQVLWKACRPDSLATFQTEEA